MKVAELIELLKMFPPDTEIAMPLPDVVAVRSPAPLSEAAFRAILAENDRQFSARLANFRARGI